MRAAWPAAVSLCAFDHAAVDITRPEAVAAALDAAHPELVINLAAYTAVDRAESEPDAAQAVNCTAAANVAADCARRGTPLIHLSTDYVFDGDKTGAYVEDDPVNPLGVYGRTKEAGERAVREALPRHVILRTSWVYGAFGQNFVKTMLRLGGERPALRVVADQRGSPTAAADIAAALVAVAARLGEPDPPWGTYHFAGGGVTTWHGFAVAIFELAAPRLGRAPRVEPIATADYPTAARRPANSVLDCAKIARAFGVAAPPWRQSLARVVAELVERPG
jgi:dTDP-4-dehydrorhamnose reductase